MLNISHLHISVSGELSSMSAAFPDSSFTFDLSKVTVEVHDARTGQVLGRPESHGASTLTLKRDRVLKSSLAWTPADNADNAFILSWVMLVYCDILQLVTFDYLAMSCCSCLLALSLTI